MQPYYMQVEPLFSQLRQSFRTLQLILVVLTGKTPIYGEQGGGIGDERGEGGRGRGREGGRQAVCLLLCFASTSQGHMTSSVFNRNEVSFCPLTPTHTHSGSEACG